MKLFACQSYRPFRFTIVALFGALLSLQAVPCLAQQDTDAAPFDVFNDPINAVKIFRHLEKNAAEQKVNQAKDALVLLIQQLEDADTSSDVSLDSLTNQTVSDSNALYPHMVKSNLYLGQFYNCGHCDRSHVTMSCGVVIDESGLALTNYHVMKTTGKVITEGFMAMTYDGKCFEVEEVLAADEAADVALVRLKANGHKFHAAPIAKTRPLPTDEVRMVSHPSGEFYVMTKGEVSRYSRTAMRNSPEKKTSVWMEITADFAGGSSGAGVFNSAGEVIGVASRILPISRNSSKTKTKTTKDGKPVARQKYAEIILRRCVDLAGVKACFNSSESSESSDSKQQMKTE